ncbi:FMN-binding protein [Kribbella monticola]|uniref:FMN-binding protein n=1 Tax=Kribbella monticola TaxID=2185285 RepID=UPI000DD35DAB|nr:FMN-binding protein [Kribbella monticola]
MRRGTTLAMSAISLAVVALGLRVSTKPAEHQSSASVLPSRPPRPVVPSRSGTLPRSPKPTSDPSAAPRRSRTPTPRTTSAAAPTRLTINGTLVDTPYGPVQVQLRIRTGRIVAAKAAVRPQGDSQTDSINSRAVPQLNQEVIQAQNGRIDTVSGATYTSAGYKTSLQAALDSAHQAGAL